MWRHTLRLSEFAETTLRQNLAHTRLIAAELFDKQCRGGLDTDLTTAAPPGCVVKLTTLA